MESFRGCVAPAQGAGSSRADTAQVVPRPEGCAERGARPAGQDPRPRTKGPAPAGPGSRAPRGGAGGAGPAWTPGTDPCPDLDSGPCPARSPGAGPTPTRVPGRSLPGARLWAVPQNGPRPRRASAGPSARGVPGRARVTVRGPPIAPVRGAPSAPRATRASPPPLRGPCAKPACRRRDPRPSPPPPLFPLVGRPGNRRRLDERGETPACHWPLGVSVSADHGPSWSDGGQGTCRDLCGCGPGSWPPSPGRLRGRAQAMRLAREAGQAWRPIPGLGPVGSIATPKFPGILLQRLLLAARRARPTAPVIFLTVREGAFCCPPVLQTGNPPRR